jgi:hypothetical protein
MKDSEVLVFGSGFFLSLSPYLFLYVTKYAFTGLFQSSTLTHVGIRTGWIARIYGVFYLLFFCLYMYGAFVILPALLELGPPKILLALVSPLPTNSEVGLLFIAMGASLAIATWLLMRFRFRHTTPTPAVAHHRRGSYLHLQANSGAIFVLGLIMMFNSPMWLYIVIPAAGMYVPLLLGVKPEDIYPPQKPV